MRLSEKGIALKEQRILELKKQLQVVCAEAAEYGTKGICEGELDDASQLYRMQSETLLMNLIAREQADIRNAEIIAEDSFSEELVNYGDKVTISLTYADEEPFEVTYELVDSLDSFTNGIDKAISVDSPIGAAIYGKEVGEIVTAVTPSGLLTIQILDKSRGIGR